MVQKGGWRKDPPTAHLPPLVMMLSCHPTRPADLKLARSKEGVDRKNSLFLRIPFVLQYGKIPPQGREVSGLGVSCVQRAAIIQLLSLLSPS